MGRDLTVGTRIYRQVRPAPAGKGGGEASGEGGRVVPENPTRQHFDGGTVMLRAGPDEVLNPHWKGVPWETPGGRVLVCDEPIPEDWTYLEVLFADVNFVAVSPMAGDLEELPRRLLKARRPQGAE